MSTATAELIRGRLPPRSQLVDLGWQRLRDLDKPERVHQLTHPDIPTDFPPLKSEAVRRHNLPLQATSFVAREADIEQVKALLRRHQLVTLVGPSGVGKTRLGLRVAEELSGRLPVTLIELASLADPSLVASTVGNALGLRDESRAIDARAIADWLGGKRALLVLDSCEHLVDSVAALCADLLAAVSNLTILATSTEALRVAGEALWTVAPLTAGSDAVRLFNDRARLLRPAADPKKVDSAAVHLICERLDGLPLAIELAAARTAVMSPSEIVARLGDRFGLLTSGSRSREPRHRTLRSAIDWSYELLTPRERLVFARLAVFAGGFTLEAAETICAGEGVAHSEVADTVWRLVDKSLVTVRQGYEGRTRHLLLDTLREYGLERLVSLDDEQTQQRHGDFFLALAKAGGPRLRQSDGPTWLRQMDAENDNFRAALASGSLGGEARLKLTVALIEYWDRQSRFSEARGYLSEALSVSPEPTRLRASALRGLALMAWAQGDTGEAAARCHESLKICKSASDVAGVGWSLERLALITYYGKDLKAARKYSMEALAIARQLDDPEMLAMCMFRLGIIDMFEGAEADAKRNLEAASALGRQVGDAEIVAVSAATLGHIAAVNGDVAVAGATLSSALSRWREHVDPLQVALILDGFALTAAASADDARALRLAGAARALRRRIGSPSPAGSRLQRILRQRLGPARKSPRSRALMAQGARMSLVAAVAYALREEEPV